jgi:glycine hydroxymethyltransferase
LPNGHTDFEELKRIAQEFKPKLIWCGATAYPRTIEFAQFAEIADSIGAYLVADISHIAGLIAAGVHPSPVEYAHIITTTTHKTLRGPRGAMIMVTKKGLAKDKDLGSKIDKAIFPGLQGGPHNHSTAAIAVALKEAATPEFKKYATQIVKNTKALESEFQKAGIKMVSGGSDNHLLLLDLSANGTLGSQLEYAMDIAHMTANKNTIPGEKSSPYYPSGLRLGTPALTTRGFKEEDMVHVADWIVRVIHHIESDALPQDQSMRKEFLKAIHTKYDADPFLKAIGQEIKAYTANFPIPGIS